MERTRTLTLHTRNRSRCGDQRFPRADASRGGVPASSHPLVVTPPFPVSPQPSGGAPSCARRFSARLGPAPPIVCAGPAPDAELARPGGRGRRAARRCSRARLFRPSVRPAPPDGAARSGEEAGSGAASPGGRATGRCPSGAAGPRTGGRTAAARSGGRAGPAGEPGYFVAAPSAQASLPPLNETPLLRDVQPLHLIKEIALQC